MLINFEVRNWRSFRDETQLSMVASRERQHGERLARVKKYRLSILPTAGIYGGNASGKSNLFSALAFMQRLVVKGTHIGRRIGVEPFALDDDSPTRSTSMRVEVLIDEMIYDYQFSITRDFVESEKLVKVTSRSEHVLFQREGQNFSFEVNGESQDRLEFLAKGTRENQLFLTNSVSQNLEVFKPVYDWFSNKLVLITPNSRYARMHRFLDETSDAHVTLNEMLRNLDTGISRTAFEPISMSKVDLPQDVLESIRSDLTSGKAVYVHDERGDRYLFTADDQDPVTARKMVTFHESADGKKEVQFNVDRESDGTRRLVELLPAFIDLMNDSCDITYVIDELDRSLHALLTRELLNIFLQACNENSRKQLLFTTHDLSIMDQSLLRRDEMWVTERNARGASSLVAVSDFQDSRHDKDVRRSYLHGRMGGVPNLTT